MKVVFLIFICSVSVCTSFAQKDSAKTNGFTVYYYDNGKKSSEGTLKDGKPDGYWKTYFQNGVIKSEGNRKNYELDSTWKFYNDKGSLILEVNYKEGKKTGLKKIVKKDGIVDEYYVDDVKQGLTSYYYPDGKIKQTINYVDGREQGLSKEFSEDSVIITLTTYKNGFIIDKESINRRDKNNLKQNLWKEFYGNGNVKWEGTYRNDKKNGYFKEYSPDGNLLNTTKYIDDELQKDVQELTSYDIKTEYYPNGNPKIIASYNNGVLEGIRRDYDMNGKIIKSVIYDSGIMIGSGIVDEKGFKQGPWKEFYETGELKGEGQYKDGKKIGLWKFYYKNGNIEETGVYVKGENPDGDWKWYFDNGKLLREQNYTEGLEEGALIEYSDSGTIISKGAYVEGLEEGAWIYDYGDEREEGSYKEGRRIGEWKYYYTNGELKFVGKFIDDTPDGKHIYYWDNGNLQEEGKYIMGKKDGDWRTYNYDGSLFMTTFFRNGVEVKYDNVILKPALDPNDD